MFDLDAEAPRLIDPFLPVHLHFFVHGTFGPDVSWLDWFEHDRNLRHCDGLGSVPPFIEVPHHSLLGDGHILAFEQTVINLLLFTLTHLDMIDCDFLMLDFNFVSGERRKLYQELISFVHLLSGISVFEFKCTVTLLPQ